MLNYSNRALNFLISFVLCSFITSCESIPEINSVEMNTYKCEILRKDRNQYDVQTLGKGKYNLIHKQEDIVITLNEKHRTIVFNKVSASIAGSSLLEIGKEYSYGVLELDSCLMDPTGTHYGSSYISKFDLSEPEVGSWSRKIEYFSFPHMGTGITKNPTSFIRNSVNGFPVEVEYDNLDWDIIYDLNIMAYDLWKNLKSKYSDNEIRNLYKKKESKELLEYKQQVAMTLESADFESVFNLRNIKNYHPLFTQVVLDLFFTSYRTRALYEIIMSRGYERPMDMKEGYFPFINEAKIYAHLYKKYISEKSSEVYSMLRNNEDGIMSKHSFIAHNAIVIVQTFSSKNCYEWGLFPEINRLYIQYVLKLERVDRPYINHIINSNRLACGDLSETEQGWKPHFFNDYYTSGNVLATNGVFEYFHKETNL